MKHTLINMAVEEALKSDYKHRHGCVIYNKWRIISRGHNSINTYRSKLHPRFKGPECYGVHAEASAILNARTDLRGCSILVIRINNKNKFLLSKPCNFCLAYIEYVGIKRVVYSTSAYPYLEEIKL